MTDAPDTPEPNSKQKRFRSPAYPAITLQKAVERATELYTNALHHPAPVPVLATSWGYGKKSSGLFATIAALKQFGLLVDEGTGPKRRFKLTSPAIRIVRDPDPDSEKRCEALRVAALAPKIHKELWEKYGLGGLSGSMDMTLKSYLTVDRSDDGEAPYSDGVADEVIGEYKATFAFAGLAESGTVSTENKLEQDSGNLNKPPPPETAKIGDFIQWTANGQDQFHIPRQVTWVSDDGAHIRVHGSMTGIPTTETSIVDPPMTPPSPSFGETLGAGGQVKNDINVLVSGMRLQITADVDLEGSKKLRQMLEKYEEILELNDGSTKEGGSS